MVGLGNPEADETAQKSFYVAPGRLPLTDQFWTDRDNSLDHIAKPTADSVPKAELITRNGTTPNAVALPTGQPE
jgi:hypothetical protein